MKLKYYLRGLGIGIIATTIILMISFSIHKEDMSDEQIIARAEALGMEFPEDTLFQEGTEETETSENMKSSETTESSEDVKESEEASEVEKLPETEASEISEAPESSENEENGNDVESEDTSEAENDAQVENTDVENVTNVNSETDTDLQNNPENAVQTEGEYELNIQRGAVCRDICEELFQNGLVNDAEAFRVYLGNVGYASNISIGKYQIPYGLTYEEIYHILKTGPIEEE